VPPTTTTTIPPVTTTTIPPVTTTTLPPIPPFSGFDGQKGQIILTGSTCLPFQPAQGNPSNSLNIPPAVWTSSIIRFSTPTLTPGVTIAANIKVQYVNAVGALDLIVLGLPWASGGNGEILSYLPSAPAGTRWIVGYELNAQICHSQSGLLDFKIGPFLSGSNPPPTTTPGTTTPPTSVPVITVPPPPPGPDFTKVPNYLKSDYSRTRASGTECLGYSGSAQVVVSGCDTATAQLALSLNYEYGVDVVYIKRPAENRCLMMTDTPAGNIDPATGKFARTAAWIDCGLAVLPDGKVQVQSFFVERLGTGWVKLRPLQNTEAMSSPCLSLNDLGISKGYEVAIEFQCGDFEWQRWTPRLTDSPGTGTGGGNPRPPSIGDEEPLKLLTDNQATFIHDQNRTICLSGGPADYVTIGIYGSANCLVFDPIEEVDATGQPTNARWDLLTGGRCLGRAGTALRLELCNESPSQGFRDYQAGTPGTFRLENLLDSTCVAVGPGGSAVLAVCNGSSGQIWADEPASTSPGAPCSPEVDPEKESSLNSQTYCMGYRQRTSRGRLKCIYMDANSMPLYCRSGVEFYGQTRALKFMAKFDAINFTQNRMWNDLQWEVCLPGANSIKNLGGKTCRLDILQIDRRTKPISTDLQKQYPVQEFYEAKIFGATSHFSLILEVAAYGVLARNAGIPVKPGTSLQGYFDVSDRLIGGKYVRQYTWYGGPGIIYTTQVRDDVPDELKKVENLVANQTSSLGSNHPNGLILTKIVDGTSKFGSGLAMLPYYTGLPTSGIVPPLPVYMVPVANALAPQVFSFSPVGIATPAAPGTPPSVGSFMLTGSLGGLTNSQFALAA
jgi:hypothetical protein